MTSTAPNTDGEWVQRWQGIHKMTEEIGELTHVASQLKAYPIAEHPAVLDGDKPILYRLQHELGDALAAVAWFVRKHRDHLDVAAILDRFLYKTDLYDQWDALGNMQGVWTQWPNPTLPLNGLEIDKAESRDAAHRLYRGLVVSFGGVPPQDHFEGEFGSVYHDGHPAP